MKQQDQRVAAPSVLLWLRKDGWGQQCRLERGHAVLYSRTAIAWRQYALSLAASAVASKLRTHSQTLESEVDWCAKNAIQSAPTTTFRGWNGLNYHHRALKCVFIDSGRKRWPKRSPDSLKIHQSGTFPNIPVIVERISQALLGRFWICKLHWKGIFESFNDSAIRFLIKLETNVLKTI